MGDAPDRGSTTRRAAWVSLGGAAVVLVAAVAGAFLGARSERRDALHRALLGPSIEISDPVHEALVAFDREIAEGEGSLSERAARALARLQSTWPVSPTVAESLARSARENALARLDDNSRLGLPSNPGGSALGGSFLLGAYASIAGEELLEVLVATAPRGVLHPRDATRPLARAWLSRVEGIDRDGSLERVLRRAGLAAAETLLSREATAEDETWIGDRLRRAGWADLADDWRAVATELLEIARDDRRDVIDRRSALDAFFLVVDVPPGLAAERGRPHEERLARAARAWRELAGEGYEAGLRQRLVSALSAAASGHDVTAERWLARHLRRTAWPDRIAAERVSDLREHPLDVCLLAWLGLPEDADDDALLAAITTDPDRFEAHWALALRLHRRTGKETCPAPGTWRDAAAWRAALDRPPLDTRLGVAWVEIEGGRVRVHESSRSVRETDREPWQVRAPWSRTVAVPSWLLIRVPGAELDLADRSNGISVMSYVFQAAPNLEVRSAAQRQKTWSSSSEIWVDRLTLAGHRIVRSPGGDRIGAAASASPWLPEQGFGARAGATSWGVVTGVGGGLAEDADGCGERIALAIRSSREELEEDLTGGQRRDAEERLLTTLRAAILFPAPEAREDLLALARRPSDAWYGGARAELFVALAVAGDHDLLLRPQDHELAELEHRNLLPFSLLGYVHPATWLLILAESDDPELDALCLEELQRVSELPEVARALLGIAERRGLDLPGDRRYVLEEAAREAPPRTFAEHVRAFLVGNDSALLTIVLALQVPFVALLLLVRGRRRRRRGLGGQRAAAWVIVVGLLAVVVDRHIGPFDLVPDSLGCLVAAVGCLALGRDARMRFAWSAAGAFALAAAVDVAGQVRLAGDGAERVVDLVVIAALCLTLALARDAVVAAAPPGESPPRRPVRARAVAVMASLVAAGALLLLADEMLAELAMTIRSVGRDLLWLAVPWMVSSAVVLGIGLRSTAPRADRRRTWLPPWFVLAHAAPAAFVVAFALTSDGASPFRTALRELQTFGPRQIPDLPVQVALLVGFAGAVLALLEAASVAQVRTSAARRASDL